MGQGHVCGACDCVESPRLHSGAHNSAVHTSAEEKPYTSVLRWRAPLNVDGKHLGKIQFNTLIKRGGANWGQVGALCPSRSAARLSLLAANCPALSPLWTVLLDRPDADKRHSSRRWRHGVGTSQTRPRLLLSLQRQGTPTPATTTNTAMHSTPTSTIAPYTAVAPHTRARAPCAGRNLCRLLALRQIWTLSAERSSVQPHFWLVAGRQPLPRVVAVIIGRAIAKSRLWIAIRSSLAKQWHARAGP